MACQPARNSVQREPAKAGGVCGACGGMGKVCKRCAVVLRGVGSNGAVVAVCARR